MSFTGVGHRKNTTQGGKRPGFTGSLDLWGIMILMQQNDDYQAVTNIPNQLADAGRNSSQYEHMSWFGVFNELESTSPVEHLRAQEPLLSVGSTSM